MAAAKSPAVELEVGERTVRVSNPEKPYFPEVGLKKLDVVQYYLSVGDGICALCAIGPRRWNAGRTACIPA